MKKSLIVFSSLFAGCGLLPLSLTSCSSANSVPMNQVHEFINERTFTLTATDNVYVSTGTSWIFYHDIESDNNYTYYALTNFHVVKSILDFVKETRYSSVVIGVSFENYEDADNKKTIDLNKISQTSLQEGEANSLGIIPLDIVGISDHNVPDMICFDEGWEYNTKMEGFDFGLASYLMDMTVVKYDFGNVVQQYPNSDLKQRLDELNIYADEHNDYVTPVATVNDYQNWQKYSYINSNLYAAGFPVDNVSGKPIYPNMRFGTALQSQTFNKAYASLSYRPNNINFMSLYNYVFYDSETYQPEKINTIGRDNIYGFTISNDYMYRNSNSSLAFGGGASGSMMMFATDINDPDTYKASGIYWGMNGNNLCFSPFLFNWGNTMMLPDGKSYAATTTFIDDFFAYYNGSPTEHVFNT